MVEFAPRNPVEGVYPADDYIHAMEVIRPERFLFVAGTMGLDTSGVPADTIDEQLELIWDNLRAILASAGMTVDNVIRLTSYLTDRAHMEKNAKARLKALGGRKIPTTAIVVQTLSDGWLIEIELIAAA